MIACSYFLLNLILFYLCLIIPRQYWSNFSYLFISHWRFPPHETFSIYIYVYKCHFSETGLQNAECGWEEQSSVTCRTLYWLFFFSSAKCNTFPLYLVQMIDQSRGIWINEWAKTMKAPASLQANGWLEENDVNRWCAAARIQPYWTDSALHHHHPNT